MNRTSEYLHGGYVYGSPVKYDFSANLNPLGMPESVRKAARDAADRSDRYPDPFCGELTARLSGQLKVGGDRIVIGNGADDLIYRIVYALKPKRAVIVTPTFTEYVAALENIDCEVIGHKLTEESGFMLDETVLDKLTDDVDMLFLCSPNNPTGRLIDKDLLDRIVKACERGIYLVLDECFIELAENGASHSLNAAELNSYTIILRAFTKTYAIPGLRLGYAVFGSKDTAVSVRLAGQHWSVSVPAQAAGIAALGEREYTENARKLIAQERAYLSAGFRALGFKVYPSDANFILCSADDADKALRLENGLRAEGIAIRNCWNFAGLGERFFRIAVRPRIENEALICAAERCVESWQR